MSRIARALAAVVIAVAAAAATYQFSYLRYVCNLRAAKDEASLTRYVLMPDSMPARIAARQAADEMTACIACWETNVSFYMTRAAALRMVGRDQEAEADYRRALHIDRRAELYFNLGMLELETGREKQALDTLSTAVYLQYSLLDEIPQPYQERVHQLVSPTYQLLMRKAAPPNLPQQLRERVDREPL